MGEVGSCCVAYWGRATGRLAMNRAMLGLIGVVISIPAIPKNITGRKYGEQIYNMFLMPILFAALLYG